jgi:hypothetical protein
MVMVGLQLLMLSREKMYFPCWLRVRRMRIESKGNEEVDESDEIIV